MGPGFADRRLWRLLCYEQGYYREAHRLAERELHAGRFSQVVRALHGGPVPAVALASTGSERVPLSFRRNPDHVRWFDLVLIATLGRSG